MLVVPQLNVQERKAVLLQFLDTDGVDVTVDNRAEKIGYKIREARNQRDSYLCTIGEREAEAGTLSVRSSKVGDLGEMNADEFIAKLVEEIETKAI